MKEYFVTFHGNLVQDKDCYSFVSDYDTDFLNEGVDSPVVEKVEEVESKYKPPVLYESGGTVFYSASLGELTDEEFTDFILVTKIESESMYCILTRNGKSYDWDCAFAIHTKENETQLDRVQRVRAIAEFNKVDREENEVQKFSAYYQGDTERRYNPVLKIWEYLEIAALIRAERPEKAPPKSREDWALQRAREGKTTDEASDIWNAMTEDERKSVDKRKYKPVANGSTFRQSRARNKK